MTRPRLQDSAVLVPVYRNGDGRLNILIVLRTNSGIHGGQKGGNTHHGGQDSKCSLAH